MQLTISELRVLQILLRNKPVPKNLSEARASVMVKINNEIDRAIDAVEF